MKRNKTTTLAILSGLAVIASVPAWSFFVGYTWNGGNGNWSDNTKWTPNVVPDGAGNSASIAAVGTYLVTLNSNRSLDTVAITNTAATLALGASTLTLLQSPGLTNSGTVTSSSGSIIGPVVNNATGLIAMNGGSSLSMSSATLTNNGTVNVNINSAGAATGLNFATPCVISGTGTIQMSQGGSWAQFSSAAGILVTNSVGHTIKGRGWVNALLTNNGMVSADWGGNVLTLRDQAKINNATMQATTGVLVIDNASVAQSAPGQLHANGGNIHIQNGASISGGTWNSTGGGAFVFDSGDASIQNLTNNAPANIVGGRTVTVGSGLFANNGSFNINSNAAGAPTILNFTDDTNITGSGLIQMSQQTTWAQLNSDAGKTVTNGSAHTIKGRGNISAQMVNNGTIHADWAGATLNLVGSTKTNSSMIKVSGGSPVLGIDGCVVTQIGAGQILADGANIGLRNGGSIIGGVLNSVGALNGFYCDSGDFNLQNLTTNSNFNIQGGRTVNVGAGLFANNGLLNVNYNAAGAATKLNFLESVAITGNGTIQLSQQTTWAELSTEIGKTITNVASHTIKGRGQITASLVNNGNVIADWAGAILVLNGNAKTNNATMKTGHATAALSVDSTSITQGPSGLVFAENGNVVLRNNAQISGGTLNSGAGFGLYADSGAVTIQNLTNAGKLYIQGGSTLNIGPGSLINNDLININHNTAGAATPMTFTENVTISGTGVVQMSQQGTWADIKTSVGKTVTNAAGHTFKGRGQISGSFINNGIVSADWGGAELELNGDAKTNNATMKANGPSSVLSIRNTIINQSPSARIWAETSNVGYRGTATINGGRLESQPTFGHYLDNGAPTFNGVSNFGSVNVQGGVNLNMGSNGITNNGTMNLNYNQSGASTNLLVAASATLGGSGLFQMSQQGSWARIDVAAGQTMTNDTGHTIQGRGQINGAILNKGNVLANWGGDTLALNPAAPGFTNQGTLGLTFATSGLTVNNAVNFLNQGTVNIIAGPTMTVNGGDYSQSAGTTTVEGTLNITGGNKVNMTGGVLMGSGIVNAPVLNTGTGEVQPGSSAGKLRVQGTYTQSSTGKLTIELGGTTPITQFDRLEVTGAAALAGKLKIKLINAFVPTPSNSFVILTASNVTGFFEEKVEVEGGSVDLEASVIYTPTTVTITFLTKVLPTSYAVTSGFPFGGNLASLFNSDNNKVNVLCDSGNSVGTIEVLTTSPIPTVSQVRFAFEGSAVRTDLIEIISLWSYTANDWVDIEPLSNSTVPDRRRVFISGANPQQYVQTGTLQMKARSQWIPTQDLQAGDGWTVRADQMVWFVGP